MSIHCSVMITVVVHLRGYKSHSSSRNILCLVSYFYFSIMEYFQLNSGYKMPMIGLGCGLMQTVDHVALELIINRALEIGYRHFDTAYYYANESVLGKVFRKWLDDGKISREELFVTSKLPPVGNRPEKVRHFLELSLKALGLDYVDLYLIHGPVGWTYFDDKIMDPKGPDGKPQIDMTTNLEALWGAMEDQVDAGLARSIGVSQFTPTQLQRICKVSRIMPANVQVEFHAYFQQKELRRICEGRGISLVAFGPLGSQGRSDSLKRNGSTATFTSPRIMEDPIVIKLGEKYGKTPAQILLRHLIQIGVTPIPTSSNFTRLNENFQVFNFELTEEEVNQMNSLDKGESGRSFTASLYHPGTWLHPEFPY